jgi:hypothetical protein
VVAETILVSTRGLAALMIILAVVLAAVFWLDRTPKQEPTAVSGAAAQEILRIPRDRIAALEIGSDETACRLEHDAGGGWRIGGPARSEADPRPVEALIDALVGARILRVVEEKGDPRRFGLEPPERVARAFVADGSRVLALSIGRHSPVGSERYASVGDGRIVLVDGSLAQQLDRPCGEYREKRLFPVEPEKIRRIAITRASGRLVLERSGSEWRLIEPVKDLADDVTAEGLARELASLSLRRWLEERERDKALTALLKPAADITLETSDKAGTLRGVIGDAEGGEDLPARRIGSSVGVIAPDSVKDLARDVDTYRDRRVMLITAPEVREVRFVAGERTLRIKRAGEGADWKILTDQGKEEAADGEKVDELIDRLRWLRARRFASNGFAASDAERVIEFVGEKGLLGSIAIGPRASASEMVEVRSTWRQGMVFAVAEESLGKLPSAAADLMKAREAEAESPGDTGKGSP